MYKKPEVKVIDISKEDIIQTSSLNVGIFDGPSDRPMILSGDSLMDSSADKTETSGNIFQ